MALSTKPRNSVIPNENNCVFICRTSGEILETLQNIKESKRRIKSFAGTVTILLLQFSILMQILTKS